MNKISSLTSLDTTKPIPVCQTHNPPPPDRPPLPSPLTWEAVVAAETVRVVDTLQTLAGNPVAVAHGVRVDIAVTVTLTAGFLVVRLAKPAIDTDVAFVT